jgi:hypothetical protein
MDDARVGQGDALACVGLWPFLVSLRPVTDLYELWIRHSWHLPIGARERCYAQGRQGPILR